MHNSKFRNISVSSAGNIFQIDLFSGKAAAVAVSAASAAAASAALAAPAAMQTRRKKVEPRRNVELLKEKNGKTHFFLNHATETGGFYFCALNIDLNLL